MIAKSAAKKPKRGVVYLVIGALLLLCCGGGIGGYMWWNSRNPEATVVARSDTQLNGIQGLVTYNITRDNSGVETNLSTYRGMGDNSPLPLAQTEFGKTTGSTVETLTVTKPDGTPALMLGMNKRDVGFGATRYIVAQIGKFEMRTSKAERVCGVKVRIRYQPNVLQALWKDKSYHDAFDRQWEANWYYSVPCSITADGQLSPLDIPHAKFLGLILNQQFTPRLTAGPVAVNRGHSVTVVGDSIGSTFAPGWWDYNLSIVGATHFLSRVVADLDTSPQPWKAFRSDGEFRNAQLVYSAGDADVFDLRRLILNRQADYGVFFHSDPTQPWHELIMHGDYNIEGNDFGQQYEALSGQSGVPSIEDMLDENGLPKKDLEDNELGFLKEFETVGCQNCPNPALQQVQFKDGASGDPIYAATIRGYWGSESSMLLVGKVPLSAAILKTMKDQAQAAVANRDDTACPFQTNTGTDKEIPLTGKACTDALAEGSLRTALLEGAHTMGFDSTSQFEVRNTSDMQNQCDTVGSGDNQKTTCSLVPLNTKLAASYMFGDVGAGLLRAWQNLQLMGPVGARTFGFGFASDKQAGTGWMLAALQIILYNLYMNGGITANPEMLFAMDAGALTLPGTIKQIEANLYGSPNTSTK